MDSIIWLIVLVVLLLVEIITLGLTTIWFVGGALVAFISTYLKANIWVQLILFIVVSLILDNFNQTGAAVVNGQTWTVRTKEEKTCIEPGTKVQIIDIVGVKLIVKEYREEI